MLQVFVSIFWRKENLQFTLKNNEINTKQLSYDWENWNFITIDILVI